MFLNIKMFVILSLGVPLTFLCKLRPNQKDCIPPLQCLCVCVDVDLCVCWGGCVGKYWSNVP